MRASTCSPSASLRSCLSRRRSLTSPEDAGRAVSPERPLLAGFQELLRPAVVEALGDPTSRRHSSADAVLAAQAREHNPDLLLGRILLARLTPDVAYRRLGAVFQTYGFSVPQTLMSGNRHQPDPARRTRGGLLQPAGHSRTTYQPGFPRWLLPIAEQSNTIGIPKAIPTRSCHDRLGSALDRVCLAMRNPAP